jgi:hypothetical protein
MRALYESVNQDMHEEGGLMCWVGVWFGVVSLQAAQGRRARK